MVATNLTRHRPLQVAVSQDKSQFVAILSRCQDEVNASMSVIRTYMYICMYSRNRWYTYVCSCADQIIVRSAMRGRIEGCDRASLSFARRRSHSAARVYALPRACVRSCRRMITRMYQIAHVTSSMRLRVAGHVCVRSPKAGAESSKEGERRESRGGTRASRSSSRRKNGKFVAYVATILAFSQRFFFLPFFFFATRVVFLSHAPLRALLVAAWSPTQ